MIVWAAIAISVFVLCLSLLLLEEVMLQRKRLAALERIEVKMNKLQDLLQPQDLSGDPSLLEGLVEWMKESPSRLARYPCTGCGNAFSCMYPDCAAGSHDNQVLR